jgi:hypothetical protein
MTSAICRWRRVDQPGLEVLTLRTGRDDVIARSHLVDGGKTPFAVNYQWQLDSQWRTRSLDLRVHQGSEIKLHVERKGDSSWRIDGRARPDLDGCEEIDLAVTPFCNTLALRRLGPPPGGAGELTTLYVDFPQLSIVPSRQRYEQLDSHVFKFIDLGASLGFEARLTVDAMGLIRSYEGLFERLEQ